MSSDGQEAQLSEANLCLLDETAETIEDHGQELVDTFRVKLAAKVPDLALFFTGGRAALIPDPVPSGKAPVEPAHQDCLYEYEYSFGDEDEWPLFVDEPLRATLEFARHVEDTRLFQPVVERIAYRHISRHVGEQHYALAGSCLLSALVDVLGPDLATEPVVGAWRQAIDVLTAMLVATESDLREQIASTEGGFAGFKEFIIVDDVAHDNGSKTFTLETAEGDSKPVPDHRGGQYVSIKVQGEDGGGLQYVTAKVSDVSTDVLCLTLYPTPEQGVRQVLNLSTGDTVNCSVPCGRFIVDSEDVEGMPNMVLAGRAEDAGMLVAVGKDLLRAGVDEVTVLVEGANNDGYVALTLAEKWLNVGVVEIITVDVLLGMNPVGVLASPALRDVVSELYEVAEDEIYIKVIE